MDLRRAAMIAHHHARDRRHQRRRQFATDCHSIEQLRLVEADHFDRRIDQFAAPVEGELAVGLSRDAPHTQIEAGRGLGVKLHLLLASGEPQHRGREVDIGQLYSSLDLVGALANQEDTRDMGFDRLDRPSLAICGRVHQHRDHGFLIFDDHRMPLCLYPRR